MLSKRRVNPKNSFDHIQIQNFTYGTVTVAVLTDLDENRNCHSK